MTTTVSVCAGYVRLAETASEDAGAAWAEAQGLLRQAVNDLYPNFLTPLNKQRMSMELAAIRSGPDAEGWLITNNGWCGMDTMRWAREGLHGLAEGDLAIVHDFTNGSRWAWTIDVKCKILAIFPGTQKATVRITQHDSAQFGRGETVTLPVSFLRPRGRG